MAVTLEYAWREELVWSVTMCPETREDKARREFCHLCSAVECHCYRSEVEDLVLNLGHVKCCSLSECAH